MGETCSVCSSACTDQQEIRTANSHFAVSRVISKNKNINLVQNNNIKNKHPINSKHNQNKNNNIILSDLNEISKSDKENTYNSNYKRKEGRKSTLDSLSFNEQRKSEFEEELRISLCSLKDKRNSSGYGSSGGGSFLSDDESYISISNKLFINDISEYLPSKKYKILKN